MDNKVNTAAVAALTVMLLAMLPGRALADIEDFIPSGPVYELGNSNSALQCANDKLRQMPNLPRVGLIVQPIDIQTTILPQNDSHGAVMITQLISAIRGTSLYLTDPGVPNWREAPETEYFVIKGVQNDRTLGGRDGALGFGLFTQMLRVGFDRRFVESLVGLDVRLIAYSTPDKRIVDAVGAGALFLGTDRDVNASGRDDDREAALSIEFGGGSGESEIAAVRKVLSHAALRFLEVIVKLPPGGLGCGAMVRATDGSISAKTLVEEVNVREWRYSKSHYLPRNARRSFKCKERRYGKRLECKFKFDGRNDRALLAYVESAYQSAFDPRANVRVSCSRQGRDGIGCTTRGDVSSFDRAEFKRALYTG